MLRLPFSTFHRPLVNGLRLPTMTNKHIPLGRMLHGFAVKDLCGRNDCGSEPPAQPSVCRPPLKPFLFFDYRGVSAYVHKRVDIFYGVEASEDKKNIGRINITVSCKVQNLHRTIFTRLFDRDQPPYRQFFAGLFVFYLKANLPEFLFIFCTSFGIGVPGIGA